MRRYRIKKVWTQVDRHCRSWRWSYEPQYRWCGLWFNAYHYGCPETEDAARSIIADLRERDTNSKRPVIIPVESPQPLNPPFIVDFIKLVIISCVMAFIGFAVGRI